MSENADFSLDRTQPRTTVLAGVFRLESTLAYDRVFEPVRSEMAASTAPCTIDIARVVFMNSSGIRALAMLVLRAKETNVPLRLFCDPESPWQKKTLVSLRMLNRNLQVESVSRSAAVRSP